MTNYYMYPRKNEESLNKDWLLCCLDKQADSLSDIDKGEYQIKTDLPGTVHWSLNKAGILPHPYYHLNIKQYDFIDEKIWYYRRNFRVDLQKAKNSFVFLCFEGVDYYSRVFLNGKEIASHEGMFGGPYIEIGSIAREENELIVEVKPANYGIKDTYVPRGEHKGRDIRPWITSRDETARDFMAVGIWKDVRLLYIGKTHIERPYITLEKLSKKSAKLNVSAELFIDHHSLEYKNDAETAMPLQIWEFIRKIESVDKKLSLEITFYDKKTKKKLTSKSFDLSDFCRERYLHNKEGRYFVNCGVELENPLIWYPCGMGEQDRYEVELKLFDGEEKLDEISFDYGIKTLELERNACVQTHEKFGKWQYIINGKKVFLKGINWMPIDILLKLDRDEYRWTLLEAKNMGVQLLRIWGGGIFESEDFYEICDELGLLVWQEFPMGNSLVPEFPLDVIEEQMMMNVYRLRNRPSLAIWDAGNEFNPYAKKNVAFTAIVERCVHDYDSQHIFYRTSPDLGAMHSYSDHDTAWFTKLFANIPAVPETGIHCMFDGRNYHELINEKEDDGKLSDLYNDEFPKKYPEIVHHFAEYIPQRIPRMLSRASHFYNIEGTSLDTLTEATQLGASEYYQGVSEAIFSNYPKTTVLIPWVFRRPWPVSAIEMIDGLGHPVAPYYAQKRVFENTHVFIIFDYNVFSKGEKVKLAPFVSNIEFSGKNLHALLSVTDNRFEKLYEKNYPGIHLTGNNYELKKLKTASFKLPKDYRDGCFIVKIDLYDDTKLVSRSVYTPLCLNTLPNGMTFEQYREKPNPVLYFKNGPHISESLSEMKTTLSIKANSVKKISDKLYEINLTVKNTGKYPAYPVKIDIDGVSRSAYLDDNYFFLESKEERTLTMNLSLRDIIKAKGEKGLTATAFNSEKAFSKITL